MPFRSRSHSLVLALLTLLVLPGAAQGSGSLEQEAYLKASNTDAFDRFGEAVAIDGDTIVVGAFAEDGAATGVDGDDADDGAASAGAAYVLVRDGATWSQQAYLKPSNTDPLDNFGCAVAVSGDTVVVGALGESSGATGVDGDESDDGSPVAGAAYVFVRSGTTWTQQAYLKASNTGSSDRFGFAVAVSGDTVVVGADGEDSGATGVDGAQGGGAPDSGAAYVFRRSGSTWTQEAYLKASNTGSGDAFGRSVAVSGDTVVVGAVSEDSGAAGVDGDEGDDGSSGAGAAYVFVRDGSTWSQQAYLKASNTDAGDAFGGSVGVSGDTVVVGADQESSAATGIGGDGADDSAGASGAAYVFVRSGSTWSQQAYVKAANAEEADRFGWSVAVSGDALAVGAFGEDGGANGGGAVYAFHRDGAAWGQQAYLLASDPDPADALGIAVAVSGDTVVGGAYDEDGGATGVDGDRSDDGAEDSGAAYVFRLCNASAAAAEVARLGAPPNPHALLPGVGSGPVLGAVWDPVVDHATFLPTAVVDVLAVSAAAVNLPSPLGTILCDVATPPLTFSSAPGEPFAIPIPSQCSLVGVSPCTQAASVDASGAIALTNALDLTIGTF